MRLLVTGGAGFIGSNFVRHWLAGHPGQRVVVYDALTYAGNRSSLDDVADGVVFVEADVRSLDAARAAIEGHEVDTVVHFAAESHNSLAVVDPGRFFSTNVVGTQTMLEAARLAWGAGADGAGAGGAGAGGVRFHHISTCEVYGDLALDAPPEQAFTESSPYRPRTPYNASKAGADHAVRAYGETYGMRVTITNCCNNYGPYQFPEKIVPLFATRALRGETLPLYATTANRREWLHVDDHCRAVEAVLERGRAGETYHVGSGVEACIGQIDDRVLAAAGAPASLKSIVADRPGHDRRYLLDSGKIRTELGWEPAVDFEQGLAETVAWYAAHREWWEPLLARAPVAETAWAGQGARR
ncbi:MAG: dTDP-glucose 4,6-dehydratase [Acidimicrobiales bacterium]